MDDVNSNIGVILHHDFVRSCFLSRPSIISIQSLTRKTVSTFHIQTCAFITQTTDPPLVFGCSDNSSSGLKIFISEKPQTLKNSVASC